MRVSFGVDGDSLNLRTGRPDGSFDSGSGFTLVEYNRLIIADTPLVEDMDIAAYCMRTSARINPGCP